MLNMAESTTLWLFSCFNQYTNDRKIHHTRLLSSWCHILGMSFHICMQDSGRCMGLLPLRMRKRWVQKYLVRQGGTFSF